MARHWVFVWCGQRREKKKKKSRENQENLGGCATAALTDKSVAALQKNSKPVQPQSRLRLLPAEVDLGIL